MDEERKKYEKEIFETMEYATHSGQYLPIDVFDTVKSGGKYNYFGEYKPEEFWRLYGKFYYKMFKDPNEKDDTKPGDRMDMNVQNIVSRVNAFSPESVLEVGCGFGRCFPYIISNCTSIKRLEGIEHSPTMVEHAHDYLGGCPGGKKIKVTLGNAKSLPYKDKEFDLIYTHVCLTHIPPEDIDTVTSEISRVVKNTIIHVERFNFLHEHPNPHRWSHDIASCYMKLGWTIHEYDMLGKNPEHHTKVLTLRR